MKVGDNNCKEWKFICYFGQTGEILFYYNIYNNNYNNMKHKIRLTESSLRRVVKESVYKILNEAEQPGSIIHGTGRNEDLIPSYMSIIFRNDRKKGRLLLRNYPNLAIAMADSLCGEDNTWWESGEATELRSELEDILNEYAPENHYFGSHPGDNSDMGYWESEDNY